MAITNARMQMRRGLEADFDPDKMHPGEWAVSTDTKYVRMCFASGIVARMATYEAFEQDMLEIQTILASCQDIRTAVSKFEKLAEQHAALAETYSITSKSWAVGGTGKRDGEDTNNSKYFSQQSKIEADRAKTEADRASSIANIGIATTEKAGIVKPDGETIRVDPDGTIHADRGTTSYTDLENKPTINDVELNGNKTIDELGGLTEESTVSFTEAEERTNIEATDNVKGIFGKVRKWFADIKAVAFSGSYSDLSNRPSPLDTYEEITANTESGKFAGALGVKEGFTQLTTSLTNLSINEEGSNIVVPSNSVTVLKSINLPIGFYIFEYNVQFEKNANGYRSIIINPTPSANQNTSLSVCSAGGEIPTRIQKVRMINVNSETTMNFYAMQKSGSDINVSYTIKALKL